MRNKGGGGTIDTAETPVTPEEASSAKADATLIDAPRKRATRATPEPAAAKGKGEVRTAKTKAAPAKRVSKAPPPLRHVSGSDVLPK